MRRFELLRHHDVSGVSGEGKVVAQGCEYDNGVCSLVWLSHFRTETFVENIKALEKVHGHEGATEIVWIDTEDSDPEWSLARRQRLVRLAMELGIHVNDDDPLEEILDSLETAIKRQKTNIGA